MKKGVEGFEAVLYDTGAENRGTRFVIWTMVRGFFTAACCV